MLIPVYKMLEEQILLAHEMGDLQLKSRLVKLVLNSPLFMIETPDGQGMHGQVVDKVSVDEIMEAHRHEGWAWRPVAAEELFVTTKKGKQVLLGWDVGGTKIKAQQPAMVVAHALVRAIEAYIELYITN